MNAIKNVLKKPSVKCKHNGRFIATAEIDNYPAVFMCEHCSFYLPFHPSEYPDGIVFYNKPVKTKKDLPPLSTGGKY